ncbi:hypothetical protein Sphch_1985 [Sphingobium chlorophenolicum L-1]|uniref:Uncharacterized protein n=1 Tax=Sphingobium chlorophenolicum L-1 TaxID=690566 RepID=F6EVA1_SPHCR|nr:hypothetical protein Sphch_1985 [Sphingobium chlorophenolicum L-1]
MAPQRRHFAIDLIHMSLLARGCRLGISQRLSYHLSFASRYGIFGS